MFPNPKRASFLNHIYSDLDVPLLKQAAIYGTNGSGKSDGTFRLLTLIPALYEAINKEKVVIIDEIDNSIHPNLMFALIKFFGCKPTKGQLIFTTHTTHLINQQELLRPDEIWLTEKQNGSTKMYSINEFKIHNTINLENGYLDGRYGAVPELVDIIQ